MKKMITIFLILSINFCYAIRAVTKEETRAYLKGLGLNNSQIEKLEELDIEYNKNMNEALENSREYRRKGLCKTKEECNKYTHNLIYNLDKNYEKNLNKFMNRWQKKNYLEYKSRIY